MNKKETDYYRLCLVRSLSCRRKGAIVSLSELRGINSTTHDPSDKAEHNIRKKSKFYSSDLLLHNKSSQTKRCEAIITFSYLMILRVRSSDSAAVEKAHLCSTMSGASTEMSGRGGVNSDSWALELSGGFFRSGLNDAKSGHSQDC